MASDKIDKLIAKREAVTAKIRQEQGRERSRQRRQDTRRKIIAGALVLAEQDPTIQAWLSRTLSKVLTRDDDRALFGLSPTGGPPPAPQQPAPPGSLPEPLPATTVASNGERVPG